MNGGQFTQTRGTHGLIQYSTAEQLSQQEEAAIQEEVAEQGSPWKSMLSAFVHESYLQASEAKQTVQYEMLQFQRQRDGYYDAEKKAKIEKKGIQPIFLKVTETKCRAAEAWISDILSSPEEKTWGLEGTPIPDLPEDVTQQIVQKTLMEWLEERQRMGTPIDPSETAMRAGQLRDDTLTDMKKHADDAAKRMQVKIKDQFVEGNFTKAFNEFISDLCTFHVGILKGPIVRRRKTYKWVKNEKTGRWKRQITHDLSPEYECISPFDAYPSSDSTTCQDGSFFIEKIRLSRADLVRLKKEPGYDSEAIDVVLQTFGMTGYEIETGYEYNEERKRLQQRRENTQDQHKSDQSLEGLNFWGSVQGALLMDWADGQGRALESLGFSGIEPLGEYEVNLITCAETLIMARPNPDEMDRRPYSKSCYAIVPGGFWGKGIPQLMEDTQQIINAAVRSLVVNMGLAAGPQAAIHDITKLPPNQKKVTAIHPLKIWQFNNAGAPGGGAPMTFFNVESRAPELLRILDQFIRLSDDITGIPAYAYGNERVAGAGRTMGGLSMLMNSAARGIRKVIARIYEEVVSEVVMRQFEYNMDHSSDETIKGDVRIRPLGVLHLIIKEQVAARRQELLAATQNPVDMQIMGIKGRAELLREIFRAQDVREGIIPSEEELDAREEARMKQQAAEEAQAAGAAQGGPMEAPPQGPPMGPE